MKASLLALLIPNMLVASCLESEKVLASMTLEEKAAQLVVIALVSHEGKNPKTIEVFKNWAGYDLRHSPAKDLIIRKKVGGVIFYGNNTSASEQASLIAELQCLSPKIPLIVTLDIETSLSNRLSKDSVITFPAAMTLGAITDTGYLYELGKEIGKQLKRIGIHWAFSPVTDVNSNPDNPVIGWRSFGAYPQQVAEHASALMKGLQDAGIIACAKHFPGHGDTSEDSHESLPKIDHPIERLKRVELYPIQKMIDAGVKSIMTAHLEVSALEKQKSLPSSLSYATVTELLQNTMGFKGIIVTDAMGMKGVTNSVSDEEMGVEALKAGNHVILCPPSPEITIDGIVKAVKSGRLSEALLNERVLKVLELKKWAFERQTAVPGSIDSMYSPEAHALKRELYTRAMTIVRMDEAFLNELMQNKAVVAIGHPTQEYEEACKKDGFHFYRVEDSIQESEVSEELFEKVKNQRQIIVSIHDMNKIVRENWKDMALSYGVTKRALQLIKRLKGLGKHITVVAFSSPYAIRFFDNADNLIIAYENEPEAQLAAAEILSGKRKAIGRLPI